MRKRKMEFIMRYGSWHCWLRWSPSATWRHRVFPRTGVAPARPLDRIRIEPASQERAVPQASAPAVETADPDEVKHSGDKTDVDAIGERNVRCKTGVGNWYGVDR